MEAYETLTTVEPQGDIHVAGVPFAPGTEVEVTICPKRASAGDFVATWARVCNELRSYPDIPLLTDDEIQREIDDYRAGR